HLRQHFGLVRRHMVVLTLSRKSRRTQAMRTVGSLLCLVPALVSLGLVGPARADEVGTAAAVNPEATGTPPGESSRTLLVGTNVVHNERIATGRVGQTQILFVDQSTVTVAPNSELVLDEFVYDPAQSTGKLAITLGQGLMRFVGGAISKHGG